MANRVLRDWTDSEKVEKLSFQAEVTFTRLFMKADDYGCFHGNPKLLKAALFPLRDIREADLSRWLAECLNAGLIAFYEESGKKYVVIRNFGQRLRTMKRRFPVPDSNSLTIDSSPPPETKQKQETESETKQETEIPSEIEFLDYCKSFLGSNYLNLEFSLKAKYEQWVADKWIDGNKNPIKNWKTKIKNTVQYLKPVKNGNTADLKANPQNGYGAL